MTLLITLCYSFSTSLCPLTGSLQAAYAALEHTTLSVGGLYLPIRPKAFNQVFESPHHTFLLVGSLGPTALTVTANFCPQELCSQEGTAESTKSLRSKRLLITERKGSLPHLLNDGTRRITADTCLSNKNHEYWPQRQAQCSDLGHSGKDQPVPAPLGAHNLMGSSGFSKNHWSPRTDVHVQGIQAFLLPFPSTLNVDVFKFPKEGISAGTPTSTDFRLRGHQEWSLQVFISQLCGSLTTWPWAHNFCKPHFSPCKLKSSIPTPKNGYED